MATIAVTRRFDLTDAQWARLEPLLPTPIKSGRPSKWTKRQLIDGIRWRVRVGAPWRDVPDCYGSWQAVYGLFRRWQRAGVWQQVVTALQARADAAGLICWQVSVDSTIARAHQHAAGARRHPDQQAEAPGGLSVEPADHALGRSRGGLTTKLHLACEQGSRRDDGIVDGPEVGPVIQWLRCRLDSSGVLQAGRWAATFNTDDADMARFVAGIWRIVLKKTTNKLVRAGFIDGPVYRNVAERHFHVGQHAMALATSGVITLASNRMRLLPEHAP